jgi:hypothetical protein
MFIKVLLDTKKRKNIAAPPPQLLHLSKVTGYVLCVLLLSKFCIIISVNSL